MNQNPTKGFLLVASQKPIYYKTAILVAEEIRDYIPDAKICLVCEPWMLDGRESVADTIIYCGGDAREKLWALSQTPWDITFYLDSDVSIEHEDITTVFDQLEDNDMVFTALTEERESTYAIRKWPGGEYKLCGGMFLYDMRNPLVKEFMEDWHILYDKQRDKTWWPEMNEDGTPNYDENWPKDIVQFDQTTLLWLTESVDKYKNLKVGIFKDDERWNWFHSYKNKWNHSGKPIIIRHWSGNISSNKHV